MYGKRPLFRAAVSRTPLRRLRLVVDTPSARSLAPGVASQLTVKRARKGLGPRIFPRGERRVRPLRHPICYPKIPRMQINLYTGQLQGLGRPADKGFNVLLLLFALGWVFRTSRPPSARGSPQGQAGSRP